MENEEPSQADIEAICKEMIETYPIQAKWYREGKTALGFFVGQAIKRTKGKRYQKIVDTMKIMLNT